MPSEKIQDYLWSLKDLTTKIVRVPRPGLRDEEIPCTFGPKPYCILAFKSLKYSQMAGRKPSVPPHLYRLAALNYEHNQISRSNRSKRLNSGVQGEEAIAYVSVPQVKVP